MSSFSGTNVLSDQTGLARELTEYEPFGSISKHERYGKDFATAWYYFTGKPLDDETGLMYYGARYYNPKLGRFITPDTVVPGAANPQNFNRYSYCGNNPVNFTDPTGHKKKHKSWFHRFMARWGDFIDPLGRAIVTGDWKHFGWQALNMVGMVVGVATANPYMFASSALSYFNTATSNYQGGGWNTAHQVIGYTALALAVAGWIADPPIDLGKIIISKQASLFTRIAQGIEQAATTAAEFVGDHWAEIQTGFAIAGMVPGVGIGFDVASAGMSAAVGDFVGAGLSAAAAVPFVGWGATLGRFSNGVNDWAKTSGILRAASRGKGNFGLGETSVSEAEAIGKAWVGEGHELSVDGSIFVSKDGLRQYRSPSYKPRLGKTQANLESRDLGQTQWQNNGHLDIYGL